MDSLQSTNMPHKYKLINTGVHFLEVNIKGVLNYARNVLYLNRSEAFPSVRKLREHNPVP